MQTTALKVAGAIFLLVAVAHFFRVTTGLVVTVNGQLVPLWTSIVGGLVAVALSVWMFSASKGKA